MIPVQEGTKKPLVSWKTYQKIMPSDEQVSIWFSKPVNIGVVLGKVSGNLIQLDFEDLEFFNDFFPLGIEEWTWVAESGRGVHIFLRSDGPVEEREFVDKKGELILEVRSQGRYAILPPSFHPSGKRYTWKSDISRVEIASIESALLESILKQKCEKTGLSFKASLEERNREPRLKTHYCGRDPACIQSLLRGVEEGMRDNTAIRLASYYINTRGDKAETALRMLQEWNQRNKPPLDPQVLTEKIQSAKSGRYSFGCNDEILKSQCRDRASCPLVEMESLTDLEIIDANLRRMKNEEVHPVIDYTQKLGLTMGTLLQGSKKILVAGGEKAFVVDSKPREIEAQFPDQPQVREARWIHVDRVHSLEIMLLSRELISRGDFEFKPPETVFGDDTAGVYGKILHYYYHGDNRWHTTIASWVIGTYMFPIFDVYPILHLQGERESGKSTLLWVLWLLSWNPTKPEASLREADLFRTIEGSRPTYLIDVTKLDIRQDGDVVDVFELGIERDGTVARCDKETLEPLRWEVYDPKAISTRLELPFEAKCIRVITEKAPDEVYTKRRADLKKGPDRQRLVGSIIRSVLKSWPKVLQEYQNLEQTDKLMGRRFQLWAPLLAVCKIFAPGRYDDLMSLAEEDAERYEAGDQMTRVEDTILGIITSVNVAEGREKTSWRLTELTRKVQEILPDVRGWQTVSSAVTNLKVVKYKQKGRLGVVYYFDLAEAEKKAEERGLTKLEREEEPEESQSFFGDSRDLLRKHPLVHPHDAL